MTAQLTIPTIEVYLDGRLAPHARPISCSFGAGADGLPEAVLEVEPINRVGGRQELRDREIAVIVQSEVEIAVNGQVVHWGKALANQASLSEGGDSIRLVSRMDEHHFGLPLRDTFFWDRKSKKALGLTLPTVFNPEGVDGLVVKNKSRKTDRRLGFPLFIDEESQQTDAAKEYAQSNKTAFWTLADAVYYLCLTLNDGRHVINPTLAELNGILPADTAILRNQEQPIGDYLPQQLDRILSPYGYSWCVQFIGRGARKLRVFKRGDGPKFELKLQPPGSAINVSESQLEACNLTADVGNRAFNAVIVVGDFERYESTFELVRAWSTSYDATSSYSLSKNDDGWFDDPKLERVWRDWVLNEAGDYNGLRPGITKPYNFDAIFGAETWVARRRKFEPCLSEDSDGSPKGHAGGVYVEWWDNTLAEWKPVDELNSEGRQVRILDRECGIRFDGAAIPLEIYNQGAYAKVRVTASVVSDTRAQVRIDAAASLLDEFKVEVLNVGRRFKKYKVDAGSRFADLPVTDRSIDDTELMETLANRLLERWNQATISGTATLTGIDYDYRAIIGQTVNGIPGRKVGFRTTAAGGQFPTIVGCKIRFDNQSTDIVLDTFRGERTV